MNDTVATKLVSRADLTGLAAVLIAIVCAARRGRAASLASACQATAHTAAGTVCHNRRWRHPVRGWLPRLA